MATSVRDIEEETKRLLLKSEDVTFVEKLLSATDAFAIGSQFIDGNWYSARDFPIRGIKYGARSEGLYAEVNYGKEDFGAYRNPLWGNSTSMAQTRGNILFLKGGYAFEERLELSVEFLNYNGVKEARTPLSPKKNTVFSVSSATEISKSVSVKSTLAYSSLAWSDTQEALSDNPLRNMAGDVQLSFLNRAGTTELSGGYFHVGPDYYSVANPFLLTDQHGFLLSYKGKIGESFRLSGEARIGKSLDKLYNPESEELRLQFLGSFEYRITDWLDISADVSPNTFKQYNADLETVASDNFIYNGRLQIFKDVGRKSVTVLLGYSNVNTNLSVIDTSWLNASETWFGTVSLNFTNTSRLSWQSFIAGFEATEQGQSTSIIHRIDYFFPPKKIMFSIGGEHIVDGYLGINSWGGNLGCEWQVTENLRLFLRASSHVQRSKTLIDLPNNRTQFESRLTQLF